MSSAARIAARGRLKKWKPKRWRPEYDRIVAYSVMGKANTWIAENLGFTPEHVSTILNQTQAIELAAKLQAKLREKIEVNIPDVLSKVAEKTAERLFTLVNDEHLWEKNPFAVVDRGLDVLKGLNHLKGGGNGSLNGGGTTINVGTAILAPTQQDSILQGLKMVAEVKKLHSGNSEDASSK